MDRGRGMAPAIPFAPLWVAAPLLVVAVGVTVATSAVAAVALAAIACAAALAMGRTDLVVVTVVVAAFASRLSVSVLGDFELRPEHAATLVLVAALVRRARGGDLLNRLLRPPAGLLGAYVLYAAATSFARAPEFAPSIGILAFLCLDWLLLGCLLTLRLPRALVYDVLAWCAAGSAVLATALWALAQSTNGSFWVQRGLDNPAPAAYALSYEPNILAGILVLSAVALVCGPTGPRRRSHLVAAALAILAIPATQTRAAVAAVAVAFAVLAVQRRAKAARRAMLLVLSAGVAALGVAVAVGGLDPGPLLNKFRAITDLGSGNGAYRVALSKLAVEDLRQPADWLFGLGVNSFGELHTDPSRPGAHVPAYLSNLPLQILHDTGLVGVALVGALVLQLWWLARRSVAAAPMLAAFGLVSLATSPFWFATTWIFAALAATSRAEPPPPPPPSTGPTADQSLALVGAS